MSVDYRFLTVEMAVWAFYDGVAVVCDGDSKTAKAE